LIQGETETGVTTFFIERTVDTGHILLQEKLTIEPEDTFGDLHDKLSQLGAKVVVRTLDLLEAGKLTPQPQTGTPTKAPKIRKEDRSIDWQTPAPQIVNRIRGLSPVPGVVTSFKGKLVKIIRAKVVEFPGGKSVTAGSVLMADPKIGLVISAGEGAVSILELQPEGKRKMSAGEFLRGYRVKAGERFGTEP
jgi:methionyl-tRNA formyltransferase